MFTGSYTKMCARGGSRRPSCRCTIRRASHVKLPAIVEVRRFLILPHSDLWFVKAYPKETRRSWTAMSAPLPSSAGFRSPWRWRGSWATARVSARGRSRIFNSREGERQGQGLGAGEDGRLHGALPGAARRAGAGGEGGGALRDLDAPLGLRACAGPGLFDRMVASMTNARPQDVTIMLCRPGRDRRNRPAESYVTSFTTHYLSREEDQSSMRSLATLRRLLTTSGNDFERQVSADGERPISCRATRAPALIDILLEHHLKKLKLPKYEVSAQPNRSLSTPGVEMENTVRSAAGA